MNLTAIDLYETFSERHEKSKTVIKFPFDRHSRFEIPGLLACIHGIWWEIFDDVNIY